MTNPAPTLGEQAETILLNLGETLAADADQTFKGTLAKAAANIKANPTVANVVTQWAMILPTFIAAAPALESEAISATAQAIEDLVNLIPNPPAPAAA